MTRGRTLVAYYSMTGHTRQLAEEIRSRLGPGTDIEIIREPRERRGALGLLGAMVHAVARSAPALMPARFPPGAHDLLVLGGPIWVGRMAAPVRTYARSHGASAPRIALFCTQGGHGAATAFSEMERICGRTAVAALAVDGGHLPPSRHAAALDAFIAALVRASPVRRDAG